MFTDMPKLMTVSLRDNLLMSIPESAFGGNVGHLQWLMLEGKYLYVLIIPCNSVLNVIRKKM